MAVEIHANSKDKDNEPRCLKLLAKSRSQPEPYTVLFKVHGGLLTILCECPAGENGQLCRHVLGLVSHDVSILFDPQERALLPLLDELVNPAGMPALLDELRRAETALKKATKELKSVRAKMGRMIHHGLRV